ncbi:MAG: S-layer homology domain-containing protein [Candidatus Peribacteraceae bacterium]|jgi:hypothetical protein|nr:S-layer homology domain-containing protein [Candidatus Peribacteraceae bacterium]HCI03718.1 hypothetical protein [Candidatus Peribacteria bacterium]|tara:strand:+ start:1832 stop:3100 length:1269 start_codon:yes stop_codon:yes gene_type:complete
MKFSTNIALFTAVLIPFTAFAAKIEIKQISPVPGYYSEWTLLKPDNITVEGRHMTQLLDDLPVGGYSIRVDPLEGATAHIRITLNGNQIVDNDYPQGALTLSGGDNAIIEIENIYTRVGKISVQTNPPGLTYTIVGPNNFKEKGTTPSDYIDVPVGLYTATFDAIEGCIEEVARSNRLQEDGRINLNLTLDCDNIEHLEQTRDQNKTFQFVSATIDGKLIIFEDVPIDSWFAPHVNVAIRTGIMSGYRNNLGNIKGEFGPADRVNIAQLAKIAHEVAGIDENEAGRRTPKNYRARDTWFETYFSSAEALGWQVFQNARLNPSKNATRAEVIATILQALDVPRFWPKGEMFNDVNFETPFASSIETASRDGVMSGYNDALGNPSGEFRPDGAINRAETAKLVTLAVKAYRENTDEIRPYTDLE